MSEVECDTGQCACGLGRPGFCGVSCVKLKMQDIISHMVQIILAVELVVREIKYHTSASRWWYYIIKLIEDNLGCLNVVLKLFPDQSTHMQGMNEARIWLKI